MSKPEIIGIIAATDQAGGLGKGGVIPWRNPEDMQMFKRTTQNSILIMGKKTYDELNSYKRDPFQPLLSNRLSIVVSTTMAKEGLYNASLISNINDAYGLAVYLAMPRGYNIFFIGGKQIFKEAVPYVNRVFLNTVRGKFDCDVNFPFEILENFTHDRSYDLENLVCSEYIKKVV